MELPQIQTLLIGVDIFSWFYLKLLNSSDLRHLILLPLLLSCLRHLIVSRATIINLEKSVHLKTHTSSFQDPHPKIEITDAFDLFLNTALCLCFPPPTMVWKKKERNDKWNQKSHYNHCRSSELNEAHAQYNVHMYTQDTCSCKKKNNKHLC